MNNRRLAALLLALVSSVQAAGINPTSPLLPDPKLSLGDVLTSDAHMICQSGYTMRQGRDDAGSLHMLLTTALPAAESPELVERHLHHFAIEFRNWTRFAWLESQSGGRA